MHAASAHMGEYVHDKRGQRRRGAGRSPRCGGGASRQALEGFVHSSMESAEELAKATRRRQRELAVDKSLSAPAPTDRRAVGDMLHTSCNGSRTALYCASGQDRGRRRPHRAGAPCRTRRTIVESPTPARGRSDRPTTRRRSSCSPTRSGRTRIRSTAQLRETDPVLPSDARARHHHPVPLPGLPRRPARHAVEQQPGPPAGTARATTPSTCGRRWPTATPTCCCSSIRPTTPGCASW